jgi:hypothetical protein
MKKVAALSALLAAGVLTNAFAADAAPETHLYWGELHLHTNYSIDAYATGNKTVTPDLAYRYARGIPVTHPTLGTKVKMRRPLDFMAVTDHSIMLGMQVLLDTKNPQLLATPWGQRALALHTDPNARGGVMSLNNPSPERKEMMDQIQSPQIRQGTWDAEIDAAEKNNIPGTFTTLIGWEYTATGEGLRNLHRCVISDADGADARKFLPFTEYEGPVPEDLWKFLEDTRARTGVDFVAIPHNSNISGGLMFQMVDSAGRPLSAEYARQRMRWERLVEITQTKGTSEVHPEFAPSDEFAEFEIRRKLLAGQPTPANRGDYVRSALLRGLELQQKIGVNPYQFGVVGGTDSHTGLSSVTESDFLGKLAMDALLKERAHPTRPVVFPAWEMSASGRTGAWATENTRKSIFAAFKRKEVYATTGTRIALRVFGGFSFDARDAGEKDIAAVGYRKGVPMGGDLTSAPNGKGPALLIHAAKDPLSGNLDRIQVVKGWIDASGVAQERIYDVAWSGDRKIGTNGKLPAIGNTVDVKTATYTNTIGSTQLATLWKDPDFKAEQAAFYYIRVLEIPTPRQSLYDAVALGIDVSETKQPASIQERAYSSPIWYTPTRS